MLLRSCWSLGDPHFDPKFAAHDYARGGAAYESRQRAIRPETRSIMLNGCSAACHDLPRRRFQGSSRAALLVSTQHDLLSLSSRDRGHLQAP